MRNSTKAAALGAGLGMAALGLLTPSLASGNARTSLGAGAGEAALATPFVATLSGAAERPGPGDTDGTGAAAITINRVTGQICADLRVANIETATMAHIHRGTPNEAGPVVVDFGTFLPQPVSAGCVTPTPAAPVTAISLANAIADAPADYYVNVHNTAFPAGAIRGQLSLSTTVTGATRLLATPLRAYDSRLANTPMAPGESRTIDLGFASNGQAGGANTLAVPPGAAAAIIRVAVTNTQGPGFLKAYSAALTTEPPTAALNWDKSEAIIGEEQMVAVDNLGRIKLTAGPQNTGSTHVVVDVTGFVY